ncbi:MAG: hypothetical protein HY826_12210 [Actinobacteria bacterium]|nr:hypothetical protein [Actinomycetota bacterium]
MKAMPTLLHHHSHATLMRRRRLSRTWAGMVLGWSLIRTLIVWAAVGDYGLNPWIYLAIDLCSAIVDAITTPLMVICFVDDRYRKAVQWGLIALVAFLVPDLYIFLGTRTLPMKLIVIICAIIALTLMIGVIGVVRKIRRAKALRLSAACLRPSD